jgi:hypothetical protein
VQCDEVLRCSTFTVVPAVSRSPPTNNTSRGLVPAPSHLTTSEAKKGCVDGRYCHPTRKCTRERRSPGPRVSAAHITEDAKQKPLKLRPLPYRHQSSMANQVCLSKRRNPRELYPKRKVVKHVRHSIKSSLEFKLQQQGRAHRTTGPKSSTAQESPRQQACCPTPPTACRQTPRSLLQSNEEKL